MPKSGKTDKNRWQVMPQDAGMPLQDFLAVKMGVSKRVAKQHIDARAAWVNDRCVWMARHSLKKGDSVMISKAVDSPTARSKAPASLPVLYEDEDYIVIDKPAGLLSNESDTSAESVVRVQTGNGELRAVHRLDRDTTGCLLMAKSAAAKEAAISIFKEHRISKTYRAIVHNRWDAESTTLMLPIEGERALTNVSCVKANDTASYRVVRLETGRTHQIRKHLAMARHPIAGDRQYGPKEIESGLFRSIPRPMLHSVELMLDHPMHPGRMIKVFAPVPLDFHRALRALSLE